MKTYPNVDLHIHSGYSDDGELEVQTIVEKCLKNGVKTFSLTDHDCVLGNSEAVELAAAMGLCFMPGIEISCCYNGINLHLLGINISWESSDFKTLNDELKRRTMDSFSAMIDNIRKLGFMVDSDEVLSRSGKKTPTPELIAEVMLSDKTFETELLKPYMPGGTRSDMPFINFYLDYFAQGKPAHVPIAYMSFKEAIALVKDNGGVPVVAHPGLNLTGNEKVIEQLLDIGAMGAEVFNNYHTDAQIGYFAELIHKRNAIMTCGSDFHGKTKPLIDIGRYKFDTRYYGYLLSCVERLKNNE